MHPCRKDAFYGDHQKNLNVDRPSFESKLWVYLHSYFSGTFEIEEGICGKLLKVHEMYRNES